MEGEASRPHLYSTNMARCARCDRKADGRNIQENLVGPVERLFVPVVRFYLEVERKASEAPPPERCGTALKGATTVCARVRARVCARHCPHLCPGVVPLCVCLCVHCASVCLKWVCLSLCLCVRVCVHSCVFVRLSLYVCVSQVRVCASGCAPLFVCVTGGCLCTSLHVFVCFWCVRVSQVCVCLWCVCVTPCMFVCNSLCVYVAVCASLCVCARVLCLCVYLCACLCVPLCVFVCTSVRVFV